MSREVIGVQVDEAGMGVDHAGHEAGAVGLGGWPAAVADLAQPVGDGGRWWSCAIAVLHPTLARHGFSCLVLGHRTRSVSHPREQYHIPGNRQG